MRTVTPAGARNGMSSIESGSVGSGVSVRSDHRAVGRAPVLLVGSGRSGSNWVLDIFDLSPVTHCRNEPQSLKGSPLGRLPSPLCDFESVEPDGKAWDEGIRWTVERMGRRDAWHPYEKDYWRTAALRVGLIRALRSPRGRRLLSMTSSSLSGAEWVPPRWAVKPDEFRGARPVLLIHGLMYWVLWALKERPDTTVVHLVRHPGGVLNSWINRFLKNNDFDRVIAGSHNRLKKIAGSDPHWADLVGAVESMSLEESELWYWRYRNEAFHVAGRDAQNYQLIVYEDLAADASGVAKRMYDACGLEWTEQIDRTVTASGQGSLQIATKWKARIGDKYADVLARVLDTSPMRAFWPE